MKRRYLIVLLMTVPSFIQIGCGSGDPTTPNDGRPDGTVLMLMPFAEQCELDNSTWGYLYDDIPNIGGTIIDSQRVSNRELRFYLPPSSGLFWLVVKQGTKQLVEVSFQTSERDLQFDPPLVCE